MKRFLLLILISGTAISSDFKNAATFAITSKSGNTNVKNYSLGFSSVSEGNITFFGLPLEDSEISFNISHARGSYQQTLLENNGQVSLVFDYHANQKFSPFTFITAEYDSMANLKRRANIGLGAKVRFGSAFSVSVAALFEQELYLGEDVTNFGRFSIRPKYKKAFDSGVSVSWIYFYQPAFNDMSNYLLNNSLVVSVRTRLDWLAITISAKDFYNSQPAPGTDKRDVSASLGFTANF